MTELNLLVVLTGEYGRRHFENIHAHAPTAWMVEEWRAPSLLPPVVDYPEEYVPDDLPASDVILSLAEWPGVAELIPEIVKVTGAGAVIAPVDSEAWLPRGLARQLRGWLAEMGVECVTPKPFCSLTPNAYMTARGARVSYENPLIAAFAERFGRPDFSVLVEDGVVAGVEVLRDAACGCARHVAEGLVGTPVEEAAERSGLLHHHYPCLATMGIDVDYDDTLMHVSGNIMKDEVAAEVKEHAPIRYLRPGG